MESIKSSESELGCSSLCRKFVFCGFLCTEAWVLAFLGLDLHAGAICPFFPQAWQVARH